MTSSRPFLPFAMACVGIALFSAMDAVMKGLTLQMGAYNAMFWRTLAGTGIGALAFLIVRPPAPTRAGLTLHAKRGAVASVMAVTFFWGIARVPLAEGIALSFIAPLIALYLAAVLLGERIGRAAILASLLGIVGVLVILAGKLGGHHSRDSLLGIGAVFVSAIFYAYNLILQRQQAQVASPVEIAFFQAAVVTVILGSMSPFLAEVPAPAQWPGIVGAAALAFVSLLLLSWAYARAEAQVLLTVEYTAFIWAAIMGWLFFAEPVTLTTLAGTALIVTGCILVARQKPSPPTHVEAAMV